jgi:hypothetical protein
MLMVNVTTTVSVIYANCAYIKRLGSGENFTVII